MNDQARVAERAGGRCELCTGTDRLTFAHRVNRSHGGPATVANGCRLCWPCHAWTEHNPSKAWAGGWRIKSTDGRAPASVPVWLAIWGGTWPGWFLLADDGTYRPVENGPAPELPPWVHLTGSYPSDGDRLF